MRNIGEAFTFIFRDPNWIVKVLIGTIFSILSIVLIGIPVLYGYYIELLQRVQRGEQYPLPEWKDVGVKFIVGFKYLSTLLIYYLPMLVVLIPVVMMLVLAALHGDNPEEVMGGAAFSVVIFLFIIPYSLIVTIITPMISIEFAATESIRDGIDVGTVMNDVRQRWEDALVVTLIYFAIGMAAAVGIVFFIVGIFVTSFYVSLVRFHLFGQIGRTLHESTLQTA